MAKRQGAAAAARKTKTSTSTKSPPAGRDAVDYQYPTATTPLRPDVGTQAQFRKRKPPKSYRYDSSLSPALNYDGQHPARELGEWLLSLVEEAAKLPAPHAFPEPRSFRSGNGRVTQSVSSLSEAVAALRALSGPFLDWAGKAERVSFDVPTLPLFVHERLSTQAIIQTLTGHKRDQQLGLFSLFNDPQRPVAEQVLRAYEHQEKWANRMILGDSLVVMNSLLGYEGLGGQVQMIYMDPPYGVKFGSNFQPFVRKRDVSHNDDTDMTREPEMVQAYRDTWELGLHSYLTYLRDRLLVARELLHPSGSVFVQISEANVHHVREVLDEVFGTTNALTTIIFKKTGAEDSVGVANTADYLLWYARDAARVRIRPLYRMKSPGEEGAKQYVYARSPDFKTVRKLTPEEMSDPGRLQKGWKICRRGYPLTSQDISDTRSGTFEFEGKSYPPGKNRHWSVSPDVGLPALVRQGRIYSTENSLAAIMDLDAVPGSALGNVWTDTGTGSFTDDQLYVVQTSTKVLERCLLMTTEPGELVLDPTCGSGTTAYMAEWWGRRWITVDTSRVPMALARQRLLVATFPYYRLRDHARGPMGGFCYEPEERSINRKQDGYGIFRQHSLSSLAGEEAATELIRRESPELEYGITRVTGPFAFEATIPTPSDWDEAAEPAEGQPAAVESASSFVDRMLEVLRKSPVIRLDGGRTLTLRNVRVPARTMSLSAEATVDHAPGTAITPEEAMQIGRERNGDALPLSSKPVAIVFGPENGAINEKLVWQAIMEAKAKAYAHVYVFGFAISANARQTIEQSAEAFDVPATYVQATPDLLMGDLLKNMRSSQVFSVCGLPEVAIHPAKDGKVQVELLGVDVFDPVKMENDSRRGNDVPAWFLDTDYNGLCFHVSQAFFPRTGAWESLKKALKGTYDESVWDHLAGTTSAPFEAGEHRQVAVKVIDDRGNELMVVKGI